MKHCFARAIKLCQHFFLFQELSSLLSVARDAYGEVHVNRLVLTGLGFAMHIKCVPRSQIHNAPCHAVLVALPILRIRSRRKTRKFSLRSRLVGKPVEQARRAGCLPCALFALVERGYQIYQPTVPPRLFLYSRRSFAASLSDAMIKYQLTRKLENNTPVSPTSSSNRFCLHSEIIIGLF